MKKIVLLFLPLTLLAIASIAQDAATLNQLLSMKEDTVKVQELSAYAKKMVHNDHELSRKASAALLKTSEKINYPKGIATGYSYLAFIALQEEDHKSATELYSKAIEWYEKANDERGVAKCLGNMADLYESSGQGDKAIDARLQAVHILEKLLPNAANKADVMHGLAVQYNNFATTYNDLFLNYDKSLEYLLKAESICRQAKDTPQLLEVLSNKAALYTEAGRLNDALQTGREAFTISRLTDDNFLLAHGYYSYGFALSKLNRMDSATLLLRAAVNYAKKSGSDYSVLTSTIGLALALAKQGAYAEEIAILKDAFHNVASVGAIKYKADIENELAKAYFSLGDYKSAYQHLESRYLYRDSVIKLANNNIIADKETKYQTAQKEKDLAQKELLLQKSRQHVLYGIGAAVVALLVALFIFVYYRNKRRLHQSQIQSLQKEKEIQFLQALMQGEEKERSRIAKDLHDGVAGMLAAVKMHLSSNGENNYAKAIDLLNEAHAEVRKTSHNLMPEVLLQHGLDKALRRYCSNISNSSLQVHYFFIGEDERFTDSFELSVYRIVQELLNNIFKHSKASEATVQLSIQEGVLSVSIEDNGIGLKQNSSDGMGLELLKRRIRTLNGNIELVSETGTGLNAYLEFGTEGVLRKNSTPELQPLA